MVKDLKKELLEYVKVNTNIPDMWEHYNTKDAMMDDVIKEVIDTGIEGFKYTLISPTTTSFHNHKIYTIEGIHLDITNFITFFEATLDVNYKRLYPKWIDNVLSTYGNVFINKNTYKKCIAGLRKFYTFKSERFVPIYEVNTVEGYVLTLEGCNL
jgi:hypothetical protein